MSWGVVSAECSVNGSFVSYYPQTHHRVLFCHPRSQVNNTTHYSPLDHHYSLLTDHYSPLDTHYSQFTTHYPLLTTHDPLLTLHHSSLFIRHSPLAARHPPLITHHFLHSTPITTRHSPCFLRAEGGTSLLPTSSRQSSTPPGHTTSPHHLSPGS